LKVKVKKSVDCKKQEPPDQLRDLVFLFNSVQTFTVAYCNKWLMSLFVLIVLIWH